MAGFNLEDYETVEERIGRLYQSHPDARIVTHLVSPVESIDSIAVFTATVYLDEQPKATGFAMEKAGQGYVNKTSHVENCETSAIGRALANMGLSGTRRPSREEMQKTEKPQGSELDRAEALTAQYITESGLDESLTDAYARELEQAYGNGDLGGIRAVYKKVSEAKKASKPSEDENQGEIF